MIAQKRRLQLAELRGSISEAVRECRDIYDTPQISRNSKKAYSYTLMDRTKAALTDLSNRAGDYLSKRLEAAVEHARTTYELMRITINIR